MHKKKILFLLFLFLIIPFLSSCGLKSGPSSYIQNKMRQITIRYWRVYDGEDDFKEIIASYQAMHPNIKIEYKKLRYEEYEQALIEAFAADRGPDIFSIHNTWTRKYQSMGLLAPMPDNITMIYPQVVGNFNKEVEYNQITKKGYTLKDIKNNFVDAVYDDVVIKYENEDDKSFNEDIFALPLGGDTLVMYYNKDLLNNAGIANPPEYWNREFQQDVKKMTKQNNKGEIIQSGVALGGSENIERSTDILSLLMMQNGTEMMEDDAVRFHISPEAYKSKNYNPGLEALRFYTDFSNPAKEVYSWNETLDSSLDMFVQGKLAMMFGYSYMLPIIQTRASGMNFAIAKLPQIEGNTQQINFANYWVEAVSKKSEAVEEAWDFIRYITEEDQVRTYLEKTKKPTMLRSLIDEQLEDEDLGLFTSQILTAKSWYKGVDAGAAETIIKDMIDQTIIGQKETQEILNLAAKKVQQTIK